MVKNRKSCILNLTCSTIANDGIEQVVVLGAGLDPLSLEIHARHAGCKIFEIDVANMDTKTAMLQSVSPSITDFIKCITLDLSNTDAIMSSLLKSGWNPDAPSLMILEGISYYLEADALWKVTARAPEVNLIRKNPKNSVTHGRSHGNSNFWQKLHHLMSDRFYEVQK